MKIALILPAYNEAKTIGATLRDFHRVMPDLLFCVIDNNSDDDTVKVARETCDALPGCRLRLIRERRQGKALAVRRAFTEVEADVYVMADADSTYGACDLHKLLAPVLAGEADMVVGDRHEQGQYKRENKRPLHNFGNSLVRGLINRLWGTDLHDILSGYRVFTRSFVKSFPILTAGFELETEITLHAVDKRFRIKELPITYQDRPAGSASKLSTLRDGRKVLMVIFSILRYNRPLLFFGAIAGFFALASLAVGAIPVIEFYRTRFILHVPSAILASGLMVCAFTSMSIALILDSLARQHRHDAELRLIEMEAARRDELAPPATNAKAS
ncbi:MAG: glycosyltransferase family 2 protein [Elusimicrobiales bacterium]